MFRKYPRRLTHNEAHAIVKCINESITLQGSGILCDVWQGHQGFWVRHNIDDINYAIGLLDGVYVGLKFSGTIQ